MRGKRAAKVARSPQGMAAGMSSDADPAKLDLRATVTGTGRVQSYEELVLGDPLIDAVTGLPVTRLEDGEPMIVRAPALVETDANGGATRNSLLMTQVNGGWILKVRLTAREQDAKAYEEIAARLLTDEAERLKSRPVPRTRAAG